jgi:hypothetical protein
MEAHLYGEQRGAYGLAPRAVDARLENAGADAKARFAGLSKRMMGLGVHDLCMASRPTSVGLSAVFPANA